MTQQRVLLDENIPRKLKFRLSTGVEVATVTECGWDGIKNGELLKLAQEEFSVFISMDRGIPHQQNVAGYKIGIILLSAPSNKYIELLPLVETIKQKIQEIREGEILTISTT